MSFKSFRLFVVFLAATLLAGCVSKSRNTGYLADYAKLREGKYLRKYWSSPSLDSAKKKYGAIYVKPININRVSDKREVTAANCAIWLREALAKEAVRLDAPLFFRRTPKKTRGKKTAAMEIAVTEMAPGSSGARMLTGEFRAGHAWIRVEGRIFDVKSNEDLASFSERRHSSGTAGNNKVKGDAGAFLVREMLEQTAADIIKQTKASFHF